MVHLGTGWAKSIWNIFLGPWSQGTEIFFHEGGFDPAERLELMELYDISVLCQAPTEYRLLAKTPNWNARTSPPSATPSPPENR